MPRPKYTYGFCLDCNARQKVHHREWIRASRPRCSSCGGTLQKSDAALNNDRRHHQKKEEKLVAQDDNPASEELIRRMFGL